ncbi:MFS transporter [Marinomonas agarivorans]|nr:MFS transporter [Marinomonas agarivorans]
MDFLERRSVIALSSIYLFRMLGLFLIMPVISVAAIEFDGTSPALVGAAIGVYGLTQALLQIPMGMMSDKVGRKPIILLGLTLFAIGSLICANADSMTTLILGRAIQGTGAIASTLMALLSDVTREQNRTKAMASVGISIGLSFMASLVFGPWLFAMIGLSGLFYIALGLSIIGVGLILFVVPNVRGHRFRRDLTPSLGSIKLIWTNRQLRFTNICVFVLHASLTALFLFIPMELINRYEIALNVHSWVYFFVIGIAFFAMIPMVVIAESKAKMKSVITFSILILIVSIAGMALSLSFVFFALMLWLYFVGFNTLEATLPSLVSKLSPPGARGGAMGFFSTHQFLGAFFGGSIGGIILQYYSSTALFAVIGILLLFCVLLSLKQAPVNHLTSLAFSLPKLSEIETDKLTIELLSIVGVEDMQIFIDEQTAYLKVDKKRLDRHKLQQLVPAVSI